MRPALESADRPRTQFARRKEAQRRLLDAAVQLIATKGIDAFTLADVGAVAGYSRGLPAHYFGSKSKLLSAVVRDIRDWLYGRFDESDRGLNKLIAMIAFYLEDCPTDRTRLRALYTVLAGGLQKRALARAVAELNRKSAYYIEQNILAGIARGEIRDDIDARAWSYHILSNMRGIIAQWLAQPKKVHLKTQHKLLVGSLIRNFSPGERRAGNFK